LRGIKDIPNIKGTFKFTQDKLAKTEDLFSLNWLIEENDYMRFASFLSGLEQPKKMFDDWTIAITGEVNKPFKMKLVDLIKEAPKETAVMKMHCTIDPPTAARPGRDIQHREPIPTNGCTGTLRLRPPSPAVM